MVGLGRHGKLGLQQHWVNRRGTSSPTSARSRISNEMAEILLVEPAIEQVGVRVGRRGHGRTHAHVGTAWRAGRRAGRQPLRFKVVVVFSNEGGDVEAAERLLIGQLGGRGH